MSQSLKGQVAVVTGADSGIGQATAIEFAKHGASVLINYYEDEEGARETERKAKEAGAKACVVQADVSKEHQVDHMFDECKKELGTATILVNNAGIDNRRSKLVDQKLEDWQRTLEINLTGPFLCCRRFVSDVKRAKESGRIINVTSVHEDIPAPDGAAYCASKGGLRNLTRCLALELAEDQIQVNNIAPGMILTPINQEYIDDPEKLKEAEEGIPLHRAGKPEEIAKLALFLASPDANYCSGSTYFMDGGLMQLRGQHA